MRLPLSKGLNIIDISPHLRTEADPFSEMMCFLVSRLLGDRQSPETQ
jgi:hypothetical protein